MLCTTKSRIERPFSDFPKTLPEFPRLAHQFFIPSRHQTVTIGDPATKFTFEAPHAQINGVF